MTGSWLRYALCYMLLELNMVVFSKFPWKQNVYLSLIIIYFINSMTDNGAH